MMTGLPPRTPPAAVNIGYLHAAAAFILWGVLPIYWKHLGAVPAAQLVALARFG